MPIETILAELDDSQRKAATAESNAAVAAGAGAGKTRVLASRYAWLVMEKKLKVSEILALTFTKKAAGEMYGRIYEVLRNESGSVEAQKAVADFGGAKIFTLDSFCATVARQAARYYGISPDFKSDDAAIRELALEASLPFVLDHRDNPALQILLADRSIKTVAEELFADTALRYSSVSRPIDFGKYFAVQIHGLVSGWNEKTAKADALTGEMISDLEKIPPRTILMDADFRKLFGGPKPETPDIASFLEEALAGAENPAPPPALIRGVSAYFEWLSEINSVSLRGGGDEYRRIKENRNVLKDSLYEELQFIANTALQIDIIKSVFPLIDEFQKLCAALKRKTGLLMFGDIARLAVDALAEYPELRKVYKDEIKSVMIDEFQDNNGLQRDLIFLLVENPDRMDKGVPSPGGLCPGKVFFVGDEKQSIYRFRGADVSVFRGLAEGLNGPKGNLALMYNYRSSPMLINAFNRIFGGMSADETTAGPGAERGPGCSCIFSGREIFEARYLPVYPLNAGGAKDALPRLHFCFLDKDRIDKDDPGSFSSADLEAVHIAVKIREMVDSGRKITVRTKGKTTERGCKFGDFAVLQRTLRHQYSLERHFRDFGIPYNTDRPAGLFSDAPVNDLYSLLRLLVYPSDRAAYAALLRSPFLRLGDCAASICLLDERGFPFSEALDEKIPEEDLERYQYGRKLYTSLREDARTLSAAELLTKLWYDEGYRYETLWSKDSLIYAELFDLFFELARNADARGKTLADFIDHVENLFDRETHPDDFSVNAEREPGVRVMSIHKSKGLEFPVVFVYCAAAKGIPPRNDAAVYYNETWGPAVNLPVMEELSGGKLPPGGGNYFFNLQKDEEKRMMTAELRRLLYVAMTRAECELFLTASISQTADDKKSGRFEDAQYTSEYLTDLVNSLNEKDRNVHTFLDLLIPVLADCGNPPYTIDVINVYSRNEPVPRRPRITQETPKRYSGKILRAMAASAEAAGAFYEKADITEAYFSAPLPIPASDLHSEAYDALQQEHRVSPDKPDSLDVLLKKTGLKAADFGVIVHAFIDDFLNGREKNIPPSVISRIDEKDWKDAAAEADRMIKAFLDSPLGQLGLKSSYRETEFPFFSNVKPKNSPRAVSVSGRIDLLFESDGMIHVVDFKTDRDERPGNHLGQLAVYERAAGDIFGMKVKPWLFYLRSGAALDLSEHIKEADIEQMAAEYLASAGGLPL
ncbi:MAG: UvrD-helicase domain-containing protein [Treponema sp.]|jgi:ATP-dependent helicase/nuclease subunit A|nr:UvrD-helicase domain-containing protein [Treponema sp.]